MSKTEVRVPPAGPVLWKIVRLRSVQNPKKPPIEAKSWYLARAVAIVLYKVEVLEIELELA